MSKPQLVTIYFSARGDAKVYDDARFSDGRTGDFFRVNKERRARRQMQAALWRSISDFHQDFPS